MSKTTEKNEEKDLLFAGLARTARVANIPVDIFTYFFLICGLCSDCTLGVGWWLVNE